MQIGEPMLQLLLYKKAQNEQNKIIPEKDTLPEAAKAGSGNSSTAIATSEDYKIANEFAMSNYNTNPETSRAPVTNIFSVTISSLSSVEISRIKQIIYDLHHPTTGGETTDPTVPTDPIDPSEEPKTSYLTEFDDIDGMFEYLSTLDPTITKSTGISANQLWELSQRDGWEESHGNFFGNINKIFTYFDTNSDENLSYDELKVIIGEEIGTQNDYHNKIEAYSQQLQNEFSTMTLDEKLDFVIEKSREYFEAAGLTEQIRALDRLIGLNRIGYMDLSDLGALGAYIYWPTVSGGWYGDEPDYDYQGNWQATGMFLDSTLASDPSTMWYDLVNVMVHEITHATAFLHSSEPAVWGEYVAWQTDEDYLDSIGEGLWNGSYEKTAISNIIENSYNVDDDGNPLPAGDPDRQPVPTDKWWTYGDYA